MESRSGNTNHDGTVFQAGSGPEPSFSNEGEMRTAGVDWRMNLYGGAQHSFTHPRADMAGLPGLKYDRLADKRSWRAMLDFLDEAFR